MAGNLVGRIIMKHDRGYGFILDETQGSATAGQSFFFHPKFINGGRYLTNGTTVTFDLAPDQTHPGRLMAVNIDIVLIERKAVRS